MRGQGHQDLDANGLLVGFYGLDVYSLWASMRVIISWLEVNAPDSVPAARQAWQCSRSEAGNYVPTVMGGRYDALLWFEETTALRPLHHEAPPRETELETEPSGLWRGWPTSRLFLDRS